jgi:hypothetical protein
LTDIGFVGSSGGAGGVYIGHEFRIKPRTPREHAIDHGWRIVGARMLTGENKFYAVDDARGELVMGWTE